MKAAGFSSPDPINSHRIFHAMYESEDLLEIANMQMPFGKYRGRALIDLPEPYLLWFQQKGFPQGRLGMLMTLCLEIKINGLEHLLKPLRNKTQ